MSLTWIVVGVAVGVVLVAAALWSYCLLSRVRGLAAEEVVFRSVFVDDNSSGGGYESTYPVVTSAQEVVFHSVFADDNSTGYEGDYHVCTSARARIRGDGDVASSSFIGERTIVRCHSTALVPDRPQVQTYQASGRVAVEEKTGIGLIVNQEAIKRTQALYLLSKVAFAGTTPYFSHSFNEKWQRAFVPLIRLQAVVAAAISINNVLDVLSTSERWQDALEAEVNGEMARITRALDQEEANCSTFGTTFFADEDRTRLQLVLLLQHELQHEEYSVRDMFPAVLTLQRRGLDFLTSVGQVIVPVSIPIWTDPCLLLHNSNNNWQIGLTNVGASFVANDSEFSEEACIRQVNLWRSLSHPNIIKLQAACHVGTPFFIHEYERSLVEYLQTPQGARFKWTRLYEAALGLQFLYNRGVEYTTALTSSDLFVVDVEKNDHAQIAAGKVVTKLRCDRVRQISGPFPELDVHEPKMSDGEWRWMAPELLNGGQITRASDVFALGMCILHALTGRQPWEEELSQLRIERRGFSNCWRTCIRDDSRNEESISNTIVERICEGALPGCVALLPRREHDFVSQMCSLNPLDRVDFGLVVSRLCQWSEEEIESQEPFLHNQIDTALVPLTALNIRGQSVYSVLYETRYQLLSLEGPKTPPSQSTSALISILNRLDALLTKAATHSDGVWPVKAANALVSIISRLEQASHRSNGVNSASTASLSWSSVEASVSRVSDRKTLEICRSIQLQIDNLVSSLGTVYTCDNELKTSDLHLDASIPVCFDLFRNATPEYLMQWITQFYASSQDDAKEELLILLQFELKHHSASYTSSTISQMKMIVNTLEQDIGPTPLPSWFLPAYEVEFDSFNAFAEGSFGSVHRGKWLNTDVVIKKVFGSGTNISGATDRQVFEREADIWSLLKHENVIQLYGACHLYNQRFFVCEYASLGTLDSYIKAQRRLRENTAGGAVNDVNVWHLLYGVGCGLAFLHENSVAHGDLKSNQVLIGGDKTPKITDFGLSELWTGSRNDPKSDNPIGALGAYRWKAPEVLRGEVNASFQADVFSFGMVIVEAVTGEVPWGRDLPDVAVKAHIKAGRLPIATRRAFGLKTALSVLGDGHDEKYGDELTEAQWELVKEMCQFDPADRMPLTKANSAILRFSIQPL